MVRRWTDVSGLAASFGLGQVRRKLRELETRRRDALALGALGLGRLQDAGLDGAIEHAVASAARGFAVAIGTAVLGRLGQRDEKRGFARREMARLLAEIGERGGAHAFDVAAEGRETKVEAQDLGLGELLLELQERARSGAACRRRCARACLRAGARPAW